jgi:hypothetical protein
LWRWAIIISSFFYKFMTQGGDVRMLKIASALLSL